MSTARKPPLRVAKRRLPLDRGDQAELALALCKSLRSLNFEELVFDEGRLYGYGTVGVWEEIPPWRLSQIVQEYAGTPVGEQGTLSVSKSTVEGTVRLLDDLRARPGFFAEAPAGIAFANGFAIVTAEGIELRAHAPEHRTRFAYPFALPDARELPEPFLHFCDEVYAPDCDRADKILAIQEHGGASIAGIAPTYERAMLLVGEGNTGKSRTTRYFVAAMPPGTVTGLPPSLMHSVYELPILVGARLNVVPDIGREPITAPLKGIVSGEKRAVRSPGERVFDLAPRAGHLFGLNPPMPEIEDAGSGFARRWIIISHNRVFPEHDPKRDPEIAEKGVAACLPQLVRWFLEGAVRLKRNRRHTLPASHHLALDAWMRKSDPVRRFAEAALVVGRGWTRASELHEALVGWLAGLAEPCPITLQGLGRRLEKLGIAASQRGDGTYYHAVVAGTRGGAVPVHGIVA